MLQAVEHNKGGVILPWSEHLRGDGGDFRGRDVQVCLLQDRKDGLCPARGKRKRSLNGKAGMEFFEMLKEKLSRRSVSGKGMPVCRTMQARSQTKCPGKKAESVQNSRTMIQRRPKPSKQSR